MFHPHLSTGITKYWDAYLKIKSVKGQLALDNLFVHTETLIKKYIGYNTPTTHLAFYTEPNKFFFDPGFLDVTGIEFHGDSESAISFEI